jgi:SAM-dependent methyltransferase
MQQDPWLQRWLAPLAEHAGRGPLLEIGCGAGEDTATLQAAGLQVLAFDRSAEAVARARQRVPQARIECRDIRDPLPAEPASLGAVVASLSLHYFSWAETQAIVQRVRDALVPGGLLLCRLNADDDVHYGARGHPQIEPHYFLVNGEPKRFFDEDAVRRLFAQGWTLRSLQRGVTHKYGQPKSLLEVACERLA